MVINALNSFSSSGFCFSYIVLMGALYGGRFLQMFPFFSVFVFFSKIRTVLQMFTCLKSQNLANLAVVNVFGDRYF